MIETVDTIHGSKNHIVTEGPDTNNYYTVACGNQYFTGPTEEHNELNHVDNLCKRCRRMYNVYL